jgi:hypothetical protein
LSKLERQYGVLVDSTSNAATPIRNNETRHNEGPIEVETDVEANVVAVGLVGEVRNLDEDRRHPSSKDKDFSDKNGAKVC